MIQQPRAVGFSTKVRLLKDRPILAGISAHLTLFSIVFISMSYFLTRSFQNKGVPDVDHEEIKKNGQLTKGIIQDIYFSNTMINSEHPIIISYSYNADGSEQFSKFETRPTKRIERLEIGDTIDIKYLHLDSTISTLEPIDFPFYIFYIIPLPFLVIGILLTAYLVNWLKKRINLYRYGTVRSAEIISLIPKPGLPLSNFGRAVLVQYKYNSSTGQVLVSENKIKDFSILVEKKTGDNIKIFVSPDDESRTCIIQKFDALKNNWNID